MSAMLKSENSLPSVHVKREPWPSAAQSGSWWYEPRNHDIGTPFGMTARPRRRSSTQRGCSAWKRASSRSFSSSTSARSTVGEPVTAAVYRGLLCARRGVLEALGQALGALGGLLGPAGRHGAHDREQLALYPGGDASGPAGDQAVQPPDRLLEPPERPLGDLVGDLAHDQPVLLPPRLEVEDPSHTRIVDRGSDTPVEARKGTKGRSGRSGRLHARGGRAHASTPHGRGPRVDRAGRAGGVGSRARRRVGQPPVPSRP